MNNLSIHHEDHHLLILKKPSGIHSTHNPKNTEPSVASLLLETFPLLKDIADKPEDAGLVHRLDKETSGLIVAAKTRSVWEHLREQFKQNLIRKLYVALAEGHIEKEYNLENFIGSPYRRGKKVKVYQKKPDHGRVQIARSIITPLKYLSDQNTTCITVEIKTGVRHQIRAHCASLSHPLVGDKLYGAGSALKETFPDLSTREFFLHACTLSFTHPASNELVTYTDTPSSIEGISSSLLESIS